MNPLERFQSASLRFESAPTPDHAEGLLVALEALAGQGPGGVMRRLEKAKAVFLKDGRHGSEDNPL